MTHNIISQEKQASRKAAREELKNTDSKNTSTIKALRERVVLLETVIGIK